MVLGPGAFVAGNPAMHTRLLGVLGSDGSDTSGRDTWAASQGFNVPGLAGTRLLHHDVSIMMARTQILLDPELLHAARRRAADLGISLAAYIRRIVSRDLEEPSRPTDPASVFNLGDSGRSDVARHKDAMVGEAVARRRRARRGGRR